MNLECIQQTTKCKSCICVSESKIMYASIPYDDGWQVYVDGKETKMLLIDGGLIGIPLEKGAHNIELVYKLQFMQLGLGMSLLCLLVLLLGHTRYFTNKWVKGNKEN